MRTRFEFALPLTKAYKDDQGRMHVVGVASDTLPDFHNDRMSERAIAQMAKQATEEALPLLDNHRATFGFGKTVEGRSVAKGKARELVLDFELDAKYPQALDLFNEILTGKSKKQLSIGGILNLENPKAVRFEEDKKTGRVIRVIEDILLEHIAATRPKQAANERTGFIQAVVKGLLGEPVEKRVVPFRHYPIVTEERWSWTAEEGNRIVEAGGWALYRAAHAWFDPEADAEHPAAPETKAAYKLPHHVIREGGLKTHWPGVAAAMAALLGARGGVDVPAGDRRGIYDHLARHYREFEKEPPELKDWTLPALVEFHAAQGLVLSWLSTKENDMKDEERPEEAEGKEDEEKPAEANTPAGESRGEGAGEARDPNTPAGEGEPTPAGESGAEGDPAGDAEKGLSFLTRLGTLLRGKPGGKGEKPRPNPETVEQESPPAVRALEAAFERVRGEPLTEKARFDLRRILTLMQRFLDEADPPGEPEGAEAGEPEKTAARPEAVLKEIEAGFRGHVEDLLLKGLGALADELKAIRADQARAVEKLGGRVERMEKVAGVRQSASGQEVPAAARRPSADNPFAGIFGNAIAQARRVMGTDDRR